MPIKYKYHSFVNLSNGFFFFQRFFGDGHERFHGHGVEPLHHDVLRHLLDLEEVEDADPDVDVEDGHEGRDDAGGLVDAVSVQPYLGSIFQIAL